MMIRTVLCLLALLATPATAQIARVISGDHDGFSRLVVELPAASDWQFGRIADGYALAVLSPPESYDLAGVFDLIGRNRLASINIDPATGNLQVGLACACYAIPFEFRPGVIVIDLRDGPPPDGSSFEEPLVQTAAAADAGRPKARPIPDVQATAPDEETGLSASAADALVRDVDPTGRAEAVTKSPRWVLSPSPRAEEPPPAEVATKAKPRIWFALDAAALNAAKANQPPIPRQFAPPAGPMAALRDDLLLQISRGAARGVVDIPPPAKRDADLNAHPAGPPFAQVAINPMPGLSAGTVDDAALSLSANGAVCISDARLDLAAWERPGPVAKEISAMSSGIIGEFDLVNPDALAGSIRYALFLGFGLEAAHLVDAFPSPDLAAEAPLWQSLGRLIDSYPDPDGAFADMRSCDSAAALWAVLSTERLHVGDKINTQAVLRSFSALPLHLRLAVGPALADRFLQIRRDDVVQAIRNAIERAPEGTGAEADLISAKLYLVEGDPEAATVLALDIIENAGPAVPAAMLALVEASLAQGKPIDAQTTDALRALMRESQGAPLEAPLADALILAMASNGQADAAFDLAVSHRASMPELWSVLATLGTDNDLLAHAVRSPSDPLPDLPDATRLKIAARLVEFGYAEAGLQWLGPASAEEGASSTLLFARATLLQDNPGGALDRLAPMSDPAAMALAAAATLQLGDAKAAARLYGDLQDPAAQEHASIRARDWTGLAATGRDPWKAAAALVAPSGAQASGLTPLAEAAALLSDAAAARTSVKALLASVPAPDLGPAAQGP